MTKDEETAYLAAAKMCDGRDACEPHPTLLFDVVTVLINTGLRPEECNRMDWDWMSWDNGNNGTFLVKCGKTKAARRHLYMTGNPYKVKDAAGHSSVVQSQRYVHLSADSIQDAMERLGGYKNGYKPQMRHSKKKIRKPVNSLVAADKWWAVQDSNLRPPACK